MGVPYSTYLVPRPPSSLLEDCSMYICRCLYSGTVLIFFFSEEDMYPRA